MRPISFSERWASVLNGAFDRGGWHLRIKEADLLSKSKVECAPLVMHEAFVSRTKFITTDVGNVNDHQDIPRIVTSKEAMGDEIRSYSRQPEWYRSLADRAYKAFEVVHAWEKIVERYEAVYESVLNSTSVATGLVTR